MKKFSLIFAQENRIAPEDVALALCCLVIIFLPYGFGGLSLWGRALAAFGVGFAAIAWLFATPRWDTRAWWKNLDLLFGIFALLATLSLFVVQDTFSTVEAISILILSYIAFHLGRSFPSRHRAILFGAIVVSGFFVSALSYGPYFHYREQLRIWGALQNADSMAGFLLLPLCLTVGFWNSARLRWQKILCCLLTIFFLVTLTLTSSVGAGLALSVSILAAALWFRPHFSLKKIAWSIALLLAAAVLASLLRSLMHPTGGVSHDTGSSLGIAATSSYHQRLHFVRAAGTMALRHPVLGVGFAQWENFFPQYTVSVLERTTTPHSVLAQYFAELGFPGLGVWAWIWIALFLTIAYSVRARGRTVEIAALIGLFATAVNSSVDVLWLYPLTRVTFWLAAGMLLRPSVRLFEGKKKNTARVFLSIIIIASIGWAGVRTATSWLTGRAQHAAAKGDVLDATSTADVAMRMLPNPAEELQLATIQLVVARTPEEKQVLLQRAQKTLHANPLQPASYLLLAQVVQNTDPYRAEKLYAQGLAVDPHFVPELAVHYGILLLQEGKFQQAEDVSLTMLAKMGYSPIPNREQEVSKLYLNAATAELELKKTVAARTHLQQAIEADPKNAIAQKLLQEAFPENRKQ